MFDRSSRHGEETGVGNGEDFVFYSGEDGKLLCGCEQNSGMK